MRPIAAAVGFYGKLPCRGDFLRRRVPQEFIDVWDGWLQECISESYRQLEDKWLDAYLTSPVWRFVLTEGACGTGSYAGVMVPSVDRVGRYFPLTIVAQWNVEECALDIACGAQRWFDAAEALAMEAPDTSDLDAFDERVTQLAERIDSSGASESAYLYEMLKHSEFPHRTGQWHVPLAAVGSLQKAVNAVAFRELERTLRPLSLWWTDGSDRAHAAWLTMRGLPAASSFAAMLTGEWTAASWNSVEKAGARDSYKRPASSPSSAPAAPSAQSPVSALLFDAEDPFASPPAYASDPSALVSAPAPFSGAQRTSNRDHVAESRDFGALELAPPLQLTAHHEPISRKWDAPPQSVFFVSRPDLGLWGVSTSGVEDARHAAAQTLADVLQSVQQAGTLTALVEEVRRALCGAQRAIAKGQGAGAADPYALAHTIVFLARGAECSLVCFGEVQAIRCRSAQAQSIIGVDDFAGDMTLPRIREAESSLMDIVTGGGAEPAAIVRYESLQAGDAWLISGAPLFDEPQLPELARSMPNGALPEDSQEASAVLSAVRAACSPEHARMNGPLPVLLLAAAHAAGEA
jgi:type VI secretion system protein ImpM